jgi:hypothetical protein
MLWQPSPIDTLTIVGLGVSVYDWVRCNHAQFNYEGTVWTVNAGAVTFRHDLVFDMHEPKWLEAMEQKDPKGFSRISRRREWLKKHDKPIIMPRHRPEWPTSLTYPLRRVVEETHSCYFATGVAYMLAAAKICKVKTLKLFGCDFSYCRDTNTHDEQGRACCEYWLGRIIESGTRVEVTTNTHLLDMITRSQGRIYGYDEQVTFEFPNTGGMGRFIGPDYVESNHYGSGAESGISGGNSIISIGHSGAVPEAISP